MRVHDTVYECRNQLRYRLPTVVPYVSSCCNIKQKQNEWIEKMGSVWCEEDREKLREQWVKSQRGPPSSLELAVQSIRMQINRSTVYGASDPAELERNILSCLHEVQRHRRDIEQQVKDETEAREIVDVQMLEMYDSDNR